MSPPTLSVAIITKDERRNLPRCLASVRRKPEGFRLLEMVVVDSGSTDGTPALARRLGARVYRRPFQGYSDQKNWAFGKCRGDWILSLDADEAVTPELWREMGRRLADPGDAAAFAIPRRAYFLGRWIRHAGWWPDYQTRLFRRGRAWFNDRPVHEGLEADGPVVRLRHPLDHDTYDSVAQYLDKMNRYSTLAVSGMSLRKRRTWRRRLLFAPPLVFLKMYAWKLGFLDGGPGFVLCALSAWHEFVKYAKAGEEDLYRAS